MISLKEKLVEKAEVEYKKFKEIKENHGDQIIDSVSTNQVFTGMKGVTSLLTVTSKLDPENGIRFRGYSIPELHDILPRRQPEGEPLPEGLLYLMLLNELPSPEDVHELSDELNRRSHIPPHVFQVIDALPLTSKPMTQFSSAILACATESKFQKAYRKGIHKSQYWDTTFEDMLDLIAKLPQIAAYIYRRNFKQGDYISPDPHLDWAGNFAHMMGYESEEVKRLFRMYMFIHADHEGGNVSAHTAHLVGSALSNPYYSYAAAMTGLAGPLHGYANQEVVRWIFTMVEKLGPCNWEDVESKQKIAQYCQDTLTAGRVIPGYGHAVLRKTDPRYTAQKNFAKRYISEKSELINIVNALYDIVPPILQATGKVKNPWPNVDAYSGALLQYYGITEYFFYTVMFGVSRSLGVLSQMVWDRIFGLPIERPKSQNLKWFIDKSKNKSELKQ